ncbi:MAG: vWA domain-containing protein, partial [Candidatus Micrarchaeia archaeon]
LNIFKEIYANNPQQEQGAGDLGEGSIGSAGDTTESEQSQDKGKSSDKGTSKQGSNGHDAGSQGKSSDESISKQAEEASRLLLKLMPLLGDIGSTGEGDLNVRSEVNSVSNAPKEKTLAESRESILKLLENLPPSKYSVADKLDRTINDSPSNRGFEDKSHGFNAESIVNTYDGPRIHYKEVIKPNPYIKKMLEEIELENKPRNWQKNSTSGSRLDIHKLVRYEITKDPVDISNPYLKRIKNAGAEIWVLLDISGSMQGDRINTAKKILGSIHDSLIGSSYVHLKMFGFYSDNAQNHIFEMDRNLLMELDANGGTPTDIAVYYIAELMKKAGPTGFDKTLFIITDGYPNDRASTKDALMHLKSLIKNLHIYTIFISPEDKEAVDIFSPSDWYFNISSVDRMKEVLERGIRGIVDDIKKQLRR